MLKRRISSPRAITAVALAAVIAAAVAVTPTLAKKTESFLTAKRAEATYVSNKKASTLYLRKKAASNLFVAKATAPRPPVVGIAAGNAQFGPISATTAGYIPSAFTSFATKADASSAVIAFSGNVSCTSAKPTAAQACPVQVLVDGQAQGKVNLAPAVAASPTPALLAESFTLTTVLGKGGHTIAVQYAGAKDVTFLLKGWNLSVEAYPQPDEELVTTTESGSKKKGS